MTIGIGELCDNGTSLLLGADKRNTQERSTDGSADFVIDNAIKVFPVEHGVHVICAGNMESQLVMAGLRDRLRKIGSRTLNHRNLHRAIINARNEVIRLQQSQGYGFNGQMVIGAFLCGEPFLRRFLWHKPLEIDLGIGHFVIGSSPDTAQKILWTKRQQTLKMSLQRSLLHCYEAINDVVALDEKVGRFIGPPADFLVLAKESFIIPADCSLLPQWYETFKENSAPLDDAEYRKKLIRFARPLSGRFTLGFQIRRMLCL